MIQINYTSLRKATLFISGFVLLVLCSFRSAGGVDPEAYMHWCREHTDVLNRQQTSGDVSYSLMYIPQDLAFIRYAKGQELSAADVAGFEKDFKGTLSFQLKISVPKNGSEEFLKYDAGNGKSYDDKLNYYAFGMQQDIVLVVNGTDTIPCTDYLFERSFALSPNGNVSIAFKAPSGYKSLEVLLNDAGFGQRNITFSYKKTDLQNLPKLKKYTQWN